MKSSASTYFCLSLLLILAGCSGTPAPPSVTPPLASKLFVSQGAPANKFTPPPTLLQFGTDAKGSTSPALTLTGPDNTWFTCIAFDSSGNIYLGTQHGGVAGGDGLEILVYAPGAQGAATPIRTITATTNPGLAINPIDALAVDATGNIYANMGVVVGSGQSAVASQGIAVFSPTATNGPTTVIAGSATGINSGISAAGAAAVDKTGNIYTSTSNGGAAADSVLVFGPGATGSVPPTSTLGGSKTGINQIQGIALDSAGNIYVSTLGPPTINGDSFSGTPSILEFSAGSTGNVAPTRTITGPATTMAEIKNLSVDSAGNIYVISLTAAATAPDFTPTYTVLKFGATATGNVAPVAAISSGWLDSVAAQ